MTRFDKSAGTVFKVVTIAYLLLVLFKGEFRPDIYQVLIVPVQWCVAVLLLYLLSRWGVSKLGFLDGGSFKMNRKAILRTVVALFVLILVAVGSEYLFHAFPLTHQALADLQSSQDARDVLGVPIRTGWFITGAAQIKGDDGAATLSIPVKGSRATGELDVTGVQKDGQWHITDLSLTTSKNKAAVQIAH